MRITVLDCHTLAGVLDGFKPADLKDMKEVRQCSGASEQLRKAIEKEAAEFESINQKIEKNLIPFQKEAQGKGEAEIEEINKRATKANQSLLDEQKKLNVKYGKQEVEIKLDANYKNFITSNFEEKIRPIYNRQSDLIRIADSLEIE